MTMDVSELAAGDGWSACAYDCGAGPADRPFEQRHGSVCISIVTRGTFRYRCDDANVTLVPGALLLGDHGRCFECGHEHGTGDRCIAFHYAPALFETILGDVPGARHLAFGVPRLPPSDRLLPLVVAVERCRDAPAALEELALRAAALVCATLADHPRRAQSVGARDRARVSDAVRSIEAAPARATTLAAMAARAAMSPFHFLRVFRAVTGTTPYAFVLDLRLRDAARRLATTRDPVTAIAYEAGFTDLSEFGRRFRRVLGVSPGAYRSSRR